MILSLLVVLAWARSADAYAWMIRHAYPNCRVCHADPSGGGLLTSFGRAKAEGLLRTRYAGNPDADPGTMGEFLFGAFRLPDALLMGGDLRGMEMRMMPQGAAATHRWVWMQADLAGQLTVGRFRANASLGYADTGALPAAITRGERHNLVSRVHWLGVDLDDSKRFLLRAGRLNLPFGLRVIEHTLWVRAATRTDINQSQQGGLALSWSGGSWRGEVMAIAGNFQVRPDSYRDRGYAAFVELAPIDRLAIGASSTIVHAATDLLVMTPVWRHAHGLSARWSPFEQLAILSEFDMLLLSQPATAMTAAHNALGYAGMTQVDLEVVQGVHVMGTGELFNPEPNQQAASVGVWGSVAWFFAPHADVRGDVVRQSLVVSPGRRASATVLLGQVHMFL
ncbi:MAG: hypothetical protein HY898_20920 [Deltaproteobacteria bacterium]|nr:hypothetical protein [Deltaproteobacteria bacterium]